MAVRPVIKGFEFFLERLLKGFRSVKNREPDNLEMILIKQEAAQKTKDANKVVDVDFDKGRWKDTKGITSLIESGDVKIGTAPKTPPYQKSQADIEFEIMERIKADNKKAVEAFEKRNPKTPKKFFYGGFVEQPELGPTAHGSEALASRTRLAAPGSTSTTSTGLNYLLAEDNDNQRVPFGDGLRPIDKGFFITPPDPYEGLSSEEKEMRKALDKIMSEKFQKKLSPEDVEKIKIQQEIRKRQAEEMGLPEGLQLMNQGGRTGFAKGKLADAARRKFMKAAGAAGAGITALKTGLLGFGEKAAPVVEKVAETVSETAQSVPPYFFKLVDKIKTLGDETMATQDKAIAKKYKDYVMEEDFSGNITIIKKNMDDPYPQEVIMSYKVDDVSLPSGKGMAKVDEYEEFTVRPDGDGKMKDIEPGVPDEVVQEGTMFEDNITEFGKAEGGRIGFSAGSLAKLGITGSSRRFLEKVFGKEGLETMIKRDPEMHRGLLEVVEMFRNRDKEGLKMYMQKFLPHMDDATVEDFIIGDSSTEGIAGQLIRLGSGRDYKAKMDMIKKADDVRKLDNLEVTEEMVRKPNASGGLAKMLGE